MNRAEKSKTGTEPKSRREQYAYEITHQVRTRSISKEQLVPKRSKALWKSKKSESQEEEYQKKEEKRVEEEWKKIT